MRLSLFVFYGNTECNFSPYLHRKVKKRGWYLLIESFFGRIQHAGSYWQVQRTLCSISISKPWVGIVVSIFHLRMNFSLLRAWGTTTCENGSWAHASSFFNFFLALLFTPSRQLLIIILTDLKCAIFVRVFISFAVWNWSILEWDDFWLHCYLLSVWWSMRCLQSDLCLH